MAFDDLTPEGKLSAIYEQVLSVHEKLNDALARIAAAERQLGVPTEPTQEGS